jgi:hypothetical protein
MGVMARGQAMLNRTLGAAAGVSVIYSRGLEAVTLTATPGIEERDETVQPTDRTRRDQRQRDYLIAAADLRQAAFGEPVVGDRLTEVIDGCEYTFEVMPLETEAAWRWSDFEKTRYRVHTRQV